MIDSCPQQWSGIGTIGAARCVLWALAAAALVGCSPVHEAPRAADANAVTISVANAGALPLRCTIIFGHWVERRVEEIPPDGVIEIQIRRQAEDGALFVPRSDGRRMMIENLVCGPLTQWWRRRADLSLVPVRGGAASAYAAHCRFDGERAICSGLAVAAD